MEKRSIFNTILLKIHYRTVLAIIAVGLGILTFSGVYFFGDHIVNVADQAQKVSKVQLPDSHLQESDFSSDVAETPTSTPTPTPSASDSHVGGHDIPVATQTPATASVTLTPTPTATISATPSISQFAASELSQGAANAPVTVSVWTDFACEFCANFSSQTLPQIVSDYVTADKVRIVFHNFPLVPHITAPVVHDAALCAADQHTFWKFHDKLFANQASWVDKTDADLKITLTAYAKDLGLNTDTFISCLDAEKYINYINQDKAEGQSRGISGAPTIFVNNQKIDGAQPYSVFKSAIDAELSSSK